MMGPSIWNTQRHQVNLKCYMCAFKLNKITKNFLSIHDLNKLQNKLLHLVFSPFRNKTQDSHIDDSLSFET